MALKLYNTLTGRIEEFVPLEEGKVKMYFCGPTVYDYPHIGNLRTFVFSDILRRYLEFKGYEVVMVMNLTDVDDKTIKGAIREGISLREYTGRYAKIFFEDISTLRIKPATYYPRATENIQEMVEFIETLIKKGYAYKTEDGVYFDISSFKDYGKLSKLESREIKVGASGRLNVDEYTKDDVVDFALWKAWKGEDGENYWDTSIGRGRPGWHIECSVMSTKYLGETFDIHGGGVDLIFPHHENEIAQSEAKTGKQFVRYWVHVEHLMINGRKMSKSEGNYYTLRDLLSKGYSPKAIRLVLISTHYKKPLDFTEEKIKQAEKTIKDLEIFIAKLKKIIQISNNANVSDEYLAKIRSYREKFIESMDNNINVPEALGSFFGLVSEYENRDLRRISTQEARDILEFVNDVKVTLDFFDTDIDIISEEIKILVEQREEMRKNRKFKEADEIRDTIKSKGYSLIDTPIGVVVIKDS
ncbi:MAG: cysteine--tRNA ligase [Spirochaetia bacterium]|nr:cysteine--tRNA ligase [Spirochaetota bacterium]MCX8096239.1 cysteine--tRNA ligase [Spirochaetota bacterium]MDW8112670.1 cysteine--tRNA ligase [Spirochaetia bacterium]